MELWAKKVHLFFKRGAKMALAPNWGTIWCCDALFVGDNFQSRVTEMNRGTSQQTRITMYILYTYISPFAMQRTCVFSFIHHTFHIYKWSSYTVTWTPQNNNEGFSFHFPPPRTSGERNQRWLQRWKKNRLQPTAVSSLHQQHFWMSCLASKRLVHRWVPRFKNPPWIQLLAVRFVRFGEKRLGNM